MFEQRFLISAVAIVLLFVAFIAFTFRSTVLHRVDAALPAEILRFERVLGYGGFIHHFKNMILRPDESAAYYAAAINDFEQAEDALQAIEALYERSGFDGDFGPIRGTMEAYRSNLEAAVSLQAQGLSIAEVDAAVRISDVDAVGELQAMQAAFSAYLSAHQQETETQRNVLVSIVSLLTLGGLIALFQMRSHDLKRRERQRNLQIRELNHRVQNLLTLALAVAEQSGAEAESVPQFRADFEARLRALSAAHDLAFGGDGASVVLREMVELSLQPYLSNRGAEVQIDGNGVRIKSDAAALLALILHELTTNAVKFGALATVSGKLTVTITRDVDATTIQWLEEAAHLTAAVPARKGFGTTLIEEAVPFELGGETLVTRADGVRETIIHLPPELVIDSVSQAPGTLFAEPSPAKKGDEGGGSYVLVLEDNFMVATATKRLLEQIGHRDVRLVGTVEEAMASLDQGTPDFAILDVHLGHGRTSLSITERLRGLDVPYVFLSGYGADLPWLTGHVSLRKPVTRQELEAAIEQVTVRPAVAAIL